MGERILSYASSVTYGDLTGTLGRMKVWHAGSGCGRSRSRRSESLAHADHTSATGHAQLGYGKSGTVHAAFDSGAHGCIRASGSGSERTLSVSAPGSLLQKSMQTITKCARSRSSSPRISFPLPCCCQPWTLSVPVLMAAFLAAARCCRRLSRHTRIREEHLSPFAEGFQNVLI